MTKEESLRLFHLGAFGNRPRSFHPEDFYNLSFIAPPNQPAWMVRRAQSGGSKTDGPFSHMEIYRNRSTIGSNDIISEYIPPEYAKVQGEYGLNPTPYLRIMTNPTSDTLKMLHKTPHLDFQGLAARKALGHYLPIDSPLLEELIHFYGSKTDPVVVEFTLHNRPVGVYNHPLIVWEVRNY